MIAFNNTTSLRSNVRLENYRVNCGSVTGCTLLLAQNQQEFSGLNHVNFVGGNSAGATAAAVEFEDPNGGGHYLVNDIAITQSGANDFFYSHSEGASGALVNRLTCNDTGFNAGLDCVDEDSIDGNLTFNFFNSVHGENLGNVGEFKAHAGGSLDHADCTATCADTLHIGASAGLVTSEYLYNNAGTNVVNDLSLTPNVVLSRTNYPNGLGFYTNGETYNASYGGHLATYSGNHTLNATETWVNVSATATITVPHALTGVWWDVFNSGSGSVSLTPDSGNISGNATAPAASLNVPANSGFIVSCDGTNCFAVGGGSGGGGGSGTVNAAPQYSAAYYPNAGSASVIGGISAPSSPNNVPYYEVSTPSGGAATAPTFSPAGVPGRTVSGTSPTQS